MANFICVGALVQDVFLSHSDALSPVNEDGTWFQHLELGGKFNVNKINFSTGGGASNAATTFARQGHSATVLGVLGHDPAADYVLAELNSEGICTEYISRSDEYNTGYSVILLAPSGERTILTYRGSSTHYELKHFPLSSICKGPTLTSEAGSTEKNSRVRPLHNGALGSLGGWLYVTSLNGKMDILQKLFVLAKGMGMNIAFNPGKQELKKHKELMNLLPLIDVLLTNKEEMAQIVAGDTSKEMIKNAVKLVPVASITNGRRGAVVSDGREIVKAGLYDNIRRPLDRTGAGDSWGSGLVAKIAEGKTLQEAVHFAATNSSEVCQAIGTKTNILRSHVRLHKMEISTETM